MTSADHTETAIDWQSVRARLAAADIATHQALAPSPERAREILDARAALLARIEADDAKNDSLLRAVTFTLARETYAIEARYVREVLRVAHITPVPGAPAFLAGVANLRGEILLVFDPRRIFGITANNLTDLSRLVVLGQDSAEFALLADSVGEVMALDASELDAPPEGDGGSARPYISGVAKNALILVDAASLLTDQTLFIGGLAAHETGSMS